VSLFLEYLQISFEADVAESVLGKLKTGFDLKERA
jgi:hypothetical protein